jgi:hypothetical protein
MAMGFPLAGVTSPRSGSRSWRPSGLTENGRADPMPSKTPAASAVSAALRKDGHTKSESSKSGFAGLTEHSEGYRVQKWDEGVRVYYETGFSRGTAADGRRERAFTAYAQTLEDKGWTVRRLDTAIPCLLVTGPED